MPRSHLSLNLSRSYRDRLAGIVDRVQTAARGSWPTIDELDTTIWPSRVAFTVQDAQREAVRATSGYLTAFLGSELGRRVSTVQIASNAYAGKSRDGRRLVEALESPIIGVRAALKDGKSPAEALAFGFHRATRTLDLDVMHAARSALTDTIAADDRFDGWQRLTKGTCGACMALSAHSGPDFKVHPHCRCIPQPRVRGVPDSVPVKSGDELFRALTQAQQDEQFGEAKAALLRAGVISLAALVDESHLETDQDDFVTEKPLQDAA